MRSLKICFTQATNPVDVKWNAALGFGYLKAFAETRFPGALEFLAAEGLEEAVAFQPDVLGIASTSQDFGEATRLCDQARAAGIPVVVLGGFHITAFPETLPPSADLGVLGEGEITFGAIVALLVNNGALTGTALAAIPGIVYWDDQGTLQKTPQRPVVAALDDLPVPDHRFGLRDGRQPYLFTSRGCPYHCSFCASSVYWPNVRFHSAERVISEMEGVLEQHPSLQSLSFWDDLFTADKKRLRRIVDLFEAKGFHRRLRLVSSIRANLITDELCALLQRLKYTHVGLGAESGSDAILKKLKDPKYTSLDNQRALDTAHRHGFTASCGFVLGHYDEKEADIHATYGFILDNYASGKLLKHDITILTPMPGTQLWRWAEDHGFVKREGMEWHRLRYLAMHSNKLSGIEDWIALRENNGSLYLNDKNVPRATLYQLIRHYEDKIMRGDFAHSGAGQPAHRGGAEEDPTIPDYYLHGRDEIVAAVPASAKSVLDVGCAGGALGKALREQNPERRVVGIECVPEAARHAKRFLDVVHTADVETFDPPFSANEFDCIVFADVLEHVRDPWALTRRLAAFLRPGGTVVASVPNVRRLTVFQPLVEHGRWEYEDEGILDRTHLRFFTKLSFARLLEAAGVRSGTIDCLGGDDLRSYAPDKDGTVRMGRLVLEQVSREEFEELAAQQYLFVGAYTGSIPEAVSLHAESASEREELSRRWITRVSDGQVELPKSAAGAGGEASAHPIAFVRGFHADEGGHRWMSRRGAIRVRRDATPAMLSFFLVAPRARDYRSFPFELKVSVQGEDASTCAVTIRDRPVEVRLPIRAASADVLVDLESSQSFVPAYDGTGADRRELSVILSRLSVHGAAEAL